MVTHLNDVIADVDVSVMFLDIRPRNGKQARVVVGGARHPDTMTESQSQYR